MSYATDYTQDGLSLANVCPMCIEQEQLCVDCVDSADARLTDRAYELVDEGNLQYRKQWSNTTEPSGSDWIGSETYVRPQGWIVKFTEIWDEDNPFKLVELSVQFIDTDEPLVRYEYLPPIVSLQDGGVHEELWELDDWRQFAREYECQSCHILTPIYFDDCKSCDAKLPGKEARAVDTMFRALDLLAKQSAYEMRMSQKKKGGA
jgi:hypothetical protein